MTPNTQITQENVFVETLNYLRADEGDSVNLLCDNPEGPPNNAVICCGDWTDWQDERFEGQTLIEAVNKAALSKAAKTDIAFRPALSPPAEGEGRGDDYEGPDAGMHDTEIDDDEGVETTNDEAFSSELTPAPVDHIGDATEMMPVDWQRVGPKLVKAGTEVLGVLNAVLKFAHTKYGAKLVLDSGAKCKIERAQAALAAAQPEGK